MKQSFILTLVTLVILFLHSVSFTNAAGNLKSLCFELQGFYVVEPECRATFNRDPRSQYADYTELGKIIVNLTEVSTVSLQANMQALLKNGSYQSFKSSIEACSKDYSSGLPILKKAKDAVEKRNYGATSDAFVEFSKVSIGACEAELNDKRAIVPPLRDGSVALSHVANIGKATAQFLASLV